MERKTNDAGVYARYTERNGDESAQTMNEIMANRTVSSEMKALCKEIYARISRLRLLENLIEDGKLIYGVSDDIFCALYADDGSCSLLGYPVPCGACVEKVREHTTKGIMEEAKTQ